MITLYYGTSIYQSHRNLPIISRDLSLGTTGFLVVSHLQTLNDQGPGDKLTEVSTVSFRSGRGREEAAWLQADTTLSCILPLESREAIIFRKYSGKVESSHYN